LDELHAHTDRNLYDAAGSRTSEAETVNGISVQNIYFQPDACVINCSQLHCVFKPAGSLFRAVVRLL
jgi:hypothetical protein